MVRVAVKGRVKVRVVVTAPKVGRAVGRKVRGVNVAKGERALA